MRADNQFLFALSEKLREISSDCTDIETKEKLDELVDLAIETMIAQTSH